MTSATKDECSGRYICPTKISCYDNIVSVVIDAILLTAHFLIFPLITN